MKNRCILNGMQINKIRLGSMAVLTAAAGVCCYQCNQDYNNAEKIQQELKTELEEHDYFPSIFDYNIAKYREPIFFRTEYWKNVADSLRNEIRVEKTAKEKSPKALP